ncbi:MAG: NADH-quinone oxidoreductase subunit C [Candidatus Asgardarchaeia archaeon]
MIFDDIVRLLEQELKDYILGLQKMRTRRYIIDIKRPGAIKAAKLLAEKDVRLITISCVDNGLDFELLYHFDADGTIVSIRTFVPKDINEIESLASVLPGANWIEREIHDLFGLKFNGHPDFRRIILPYEWPEGNYPLRKPMEGIVPKQHRKVVSDLIATGQPIPFTSMAIKRRARVDLPPELPVASLREDYLKEVQELIKKTGFDKKVGFDWEKGGLKYK